MQLRLTIHAELNSVTGYGLHLIEIVRGLAARGYFPTIRPIQVVESFGAKIPIDIRTRVVNRIQPEDEELLLCPPHFMPTPGKRTTYYTMWETTRLPERSVGLLNRAHQVIVPCWWCKDNFVASGVTVPIAVVPLGHDPEVFKPTPVRMDGPCIFGAAGRLAHGVARKGLNSVVESFLRAFPHGHEDVRLHLKVHPDCQLIWSGDPRIEITRQHLSSEKVAEWLSGITCFVSGATAEGWGLWQHQALASGRPLVSTPYGGLSEYFTAAMGQALGFYEVPAREGFAGRGLWGEPDLDSMIEAMKFYERHRDVAAAQGMTAAQLMRDRTWDASISSLVNVMVTGEDNAQRPAVVVKPLDSRLLVKETARPVVPIGKDSISAVVCVYKTKTERLNRCLTALLPHVSQVILAIDGDGVEPDHIQDAKIIPVRNGVGKRLGYGRMANIGAQSATGDWLLLVNDDVYINDETIPKMLEAVTSPEISAVGCLLFYPDGLINHGGIFRSGRNFAHIDHLARRPSITQVTELEAVTLGCALIRRYAFWTVDGFDEEFDCYYEDMDMCLRLRQRGFRIVYTPFANAIHEESQTSNSLGSEFKRAMLEQSDKIMTRKWGSWFDENAHKTFGAFP